MTSEVQTIPPVSLEQQENPAELVEHVNGGGEDSPRASPESDELEREPSPSSLEALAGGKRSSKKVDKSIEHVLKALSSLSTSEEKLAALCKKYADLLEEQRLSSHLMKQTQRKLTLVSREKEQLQSEHSKAILAKAKLESLCRELQKHSKLVKEESLTRAREEEEKRKAVSAKFQTTITEIQQQMDENYTRNASLKTENVELAEKLKKLIEQYELREQHFDKVLQHKDIEKQLAEAKLKQVDLQGKEEKERYLMEKQTMLKELALCHERMERYEINEQQLKAQITVYNAKYEEFQDTLTKSNDCFNSFKTEMDKMTKRIKKLEKETYQWKTRWENTNRALIGMVDEKQNNDAEMARVKLRCSQMEKLCRALQAERKGEGKLEDLLADAFTASTKAQTPSEEASDPSAPTAPSEEPSAATAPSEDPSAATAPSEDPSAASTQPPPNSPEVSPAKRPSEDGLQDSDCRDGDCAEEEGREKDGEKRTGEALEACRGEGDGEAGEEAPDDDTRADCQGESEQQVTDVTKQVPADPEVKNGDTNGGTEA